MKKKTSPFVQLLMLLLLTAGGLFGLFILLFVYLFVSVLTGKTEDLSDLVALTSSMGLESISSIIMMALPVYLLALIFYRHEMRDFMKLYFDSRKWLLAVAAIAVYALLVPFDNWLMVCNDKMNFGGFFAGFSQQYYDLIYGQIQSATEKGVVGLLLLIVILAVIPAVCEELFFRVGVQQLMGKWLKNNHVAIVITALIFSFVHLDMSGFLSRFVMGLVLGYVFYYSRSIVPNVMLHFVNNAVYAVTYYVAFCNGTSIQELEEPWNIHWIVTILCTAASVALFRFCFVRQNKSAEELPAE